MGCLGVHSIESLTVHVRVATNFVKMMKRKKISRNKSSNFDSSILVSCTILGRMVSLFSRFSEYRYSFVLVLVEDLRELAQRV